MVYFQQNKKRRRPLPALPVECLLLNVYYESLKRDLKTKPINECRCDERLKTRVEESTRLGCPRLFTELEHLKIETRLIDEMFTSEMGEYVFLM